MKWIDRFIGALVLATVAAVILPAVLPSLTMAAAVLTVCFFVVVQCVRYFTSRRW